MSDYLRSHDMLFCKELTMAAYGMGKEAAILSHLHPFVHVVERKRLKYL